MFDDAWKLQPLSPFRLLPISKIPNGDNLFKHHIGHYIISSNFIFIYYLFNTGVSIPRGKLLNGTEFLPSPRLISGALISHEDRPNRDYTLLLMQWGQFIDHDITHTPINKRK